MNTKDYSSCVRGFHRPNNAWYSAVTKNNPGVLDSFTIGFYDIKDGGTLGEFDIDWVKLAGTVVPKMRAFDDAWGTFPHFADLFAKMAQIDDAGISPDKFAEILLSCDIRDLTAKTR
jgi:hypothetical protein